MIHVDLNDRGGHPHRRHGDAPATLTKFIMAWHWPSSPEHQAAGTITV